MRISAVTVCIDYSDYLEKILPNRDLLDDWIIVTHQSDKKTIQLCEKNELQYILSRDIYYNGANFAKGRAVNEGIRRLKDTEWVLQLDSDILLPVNYRNKLVNLHKDILYGCSRTLVDGNSVNDYVEHGFEGRTALGFFQLWWLNTCSIYPEIGRCASDDDLAHLKNFADVVLLPLKVTDVSGVFLQNHYGRGAIGKSRHRRHYLTKP